MRALRIAADICPGRRRKMPIVFPLNFKGRSALFEGGTFELERLRNSAPEAIAVPLREALDLAGAALRGLVDLPSLTFAIVVLTNVADAPLNDGHRDLLWRAFRLPVFEQLLDADGTVVARECETHDGLHLVPAADVRVVQGELWLGNRQTRFSASMVSERCECGEETSRIRNLSAGPSVSIASADTPKCVFVQ